MTCNLVLYENIINLYLSVMMISWACWHWDLILEYCKKKCQSGTICFLHLKIYYNFFLIYVFSFAVELIHILFISNGDHSSNCFRKTSLLFHKWLAERFNLDDAWIVDVWYKDTSIYNALITWIGKFCKFVPKQNCSHDFFYCVNYNIIVQVR